MNRRGPTQRVEHVAQFDTNRRTLPRFDILASYYLETDEIRKKASTADAWLSSARSVRSALKWDNERNPCPELLVSQETVPISIGKEGKADVKSSCRLYLGLHTCYNEQQQ